MHPRRKAKILMNISDLSRNAYMLCGSLSRKGYMRWFHSFSATQPLTGERRVFFIEYLIMNPSLGGNKPILGQLPYNRKRGIKPSYLLMKAGAFAGDGGSKALQLHHFYPLTELKVAFNPLVMKFGDNFYSEHHIHGQVSVSHDDARRRSHMSNAGKMEWDLKVCKTIACHTGRLANAFHSAVGALESFWHGEGIKTLYRGTVTLNGTIYEVNPEECYGYADKHWGRSFNNPWLQLASCRLISERTGKELKHSALAADGCCPGFLWFRLKKKLLLQLTYEGEDYEFNFSPLARNCKWNIRRTDKRLIWQMAAQNKDTVIKVTIASLWEDMFGLKYENPDGSRPGNLWSNGSAVGKLLLYRRTSEGKELIDTLSIENILCIWEEDGR